MIRSIPSVAALAAATALAVTVPALAQKAALQKIGKSEDQEFCYP